MRVCKVQSNAPAGMVPARVTFTEETDLFLGGKEVRAKYFGRGHTNGDAFVYFPALKVLHTGDMMTSGTPLIESACCFFPHRSGNEVGSIEQGLKFGSYQSGSAIGRRSRTSVGSCRQTFRPPQTWVEEASDPAVREFG